MSEVMTPTWWEQQAQEFAEDIGLLLVTLRHPDLHEPIRIANDVKDITSRGEVFIGWPVAPRIPNKGQAQKGGLKIQNVDEEIGRIVRGLKGAPGLSFEIVERENPDEVIYDHHGLRFTNVRSEGPFIVGDVEGYGSHGLAWPKSSAIPEYAPGIFVT